VNTPLRTRRQLMALAALVASFAACDNDPPTAAGPSPSPVALSTPTPAPLATPDPNATPASCPPLTRWSSGIHNITDGDTKPVPWILVGGHVLIDSTPLFNGRPCNAERDSCGGRACEDPRGAVWTLEEGNSPAQPRGDGYQFRIGPLVPGFHRWRVCPRADAQDAQGHPLVTGESACTEGSFTPLTEPPEN
jgi:hypothetical protein